MKNQEVCILDYGSGNVGSVYNLLKPIFSLKSDLKLLFSLLPNLKLVKLIILFKTTFQFIISF